MTPPIAETLECLGGPHDGARLPAEYPGAPVLEIAQLRTRTALGLTIAWTTHGVYRRARWHDGTDVWLWEGER